MCGGPVCVCLPPPLNLDQMTLPSAEATTSSLLGSIVGDKYVYTSPEGHALTDHPVKHSPYFQAGFGLMVTTPYPSHPPPLSPWLHIAGRRRRRNRPQTRRGSGLGRPPPTSARDARDQQQGPRVRLVPRVARAPPTHDASPRLGTLAPAQRRDGVRAAQERKRRRPLQARRRPGRTLAQIQRRVDAGKLFFTARIVVGADLGGVPKNCFSVFVVL